MSIFLNLTRQLFFLIPAIWILPSLLGEAGIWLSQTTADFLAAFLGFTVLLLFLKRIFPRNNTELDQPLYDHSPIQVKS